MTLFGHTVAPYPFSPSRVCVYVLFLKWLLQREECVWASERGRRVGCDSKLEFVIESLHKFVFFWTYVRVHIVVVVCECVCVCVYQSEVAGLTQQGL